MNTVSDAPSTSQAFDKIYNSTFAHWVWSDVRIPTELKELVTDNNPKSSLELGCGLGRFSEYMAEQGILATGIDFSPIAIEKATKRLATKIQKPTLLVGDVTNLEILDEQFDVTFDVGCFHCLNEEGQRKYIIETYRLLKPSSTILIWALDSSPSGIKLSPDYIAKVFGEGFQLEKSKFSRRRLGSHWYWLVRQPIFDSISTNI
jgi:ubiquinone/menaquinone biosynthesis C-methylase UbiE